MLLEGGIGDAYGAGFEFASRIKIKRFNKVNRYMRHPLHRNIFKQYTDDTQMAMAVAELLIEKQKWTKLDVANKFVEVFKREVRKGYAKRFYRLLKEVKSGEELLARIIRLVADKEPPRLMYFWYSMRNKSAVPSKEITAEPAHV